MKTIGSTYTQGVGGRNNTKILTPEERGRRGRYLRDCPPQNFSCSLNILEKYNS